MLCSRILYPTRHGIFGLLGDMAGRNGIITCAMMVIPASDDMLFLSDRVDSPAEDDLMTLLSLRCARLLAQGNLDAAVLLSPACLAASPRISLFTARTAASGSDILVISRVSMRTRSDSSRYYCTGCRKPARADLPTAHLLDATTHRQSGHCTVAVASSTSVRRPAGMLKPHRFGILVSMQLVYAGWSAANQTPEKVEKIRLAVGLRDRPGAETYSPWAGDGADSR